MKFNYYYGTEGDQFSFIRIPKLLLTGEAFSGLSLQAKVLYGLLLDRMGLSVKNRWLDDDNRVFIIYQIAEIQEDLGYSKKKAMSFLCELESIGLVEKKKRGFGLPSILYVKNFINSEMGTSRGADLGTSEALEEEPVTEKTEENEAVSADKTDIEEWKRLKAGTLKTYQHDNISVFCEDTSRIFSRGANLGTSRGVDLGTSRGVDLETSRGAGLGTSRGDLEGTSEVPVREPLINNTKYINTDLSNIESNQIISADRDEIGSDEEKYQAYKKLIHDNLDIDIMLESHPYDQEIINGICDLILEVLMSRNKEILISSNKFPAELVKSKLLKLNSSHLEYVLDCMDSNTTKIRNIKKYLLAALFNAPATMSSYYSAEVNFDMPQYAKQK